MNFLISIIIPMYNSEKTIEKCLLSIQCQTFTEYELILVDDGSTDSTLEICQKYAASDERIRIISKKNGGVSSARNLGLDIAVGDYIVFIDSDDTVEPYHLESLYQYGKYDFVTGGYRTQGPDGRWSEQIFCEDSTSVNNVKVNPSKYMGKYYFGVTCAKLYRKSIIDDFQLRFPIDVHNGEDSQFIFRFLNHISSIKIIPTCGYNYFYYASSLAHKPQEKNFEWRIQVEQLIMDFFEPLDNKELEWLYDRCFTVLVNQVNIHFPYINNSIYYYYHDELFASSILYKRQHGKIMEKIFIFSMEHKCYELYFKLSQLLVIKNRIINKMGRIFHSLQR